MPKEFLSVVEPPKPGPVSRGPLEALKEGYEDVKIQRVIEDSRRGNDGEIYIFNKKLTDLIPTLTVEKLREYPDIIIAAKDQLLYSLSYISEHLYDMYQYGTDRSHQKLDLQKIKELFEKQPEIFTEIATDPLCVEKEKFIIMNCLKEAGFSRYAKHFSDDVEMDPQHIKDFVVKAILHSWRASVPEERIYRPEEVIKEFGINKDKKLLDTLALEYCRSVFTTDYPWLDKRVLAEYFGFNEEELEAFIGANKSNLEAAVYEGCAAIFGKHDLELVKSFLERTSQEWGLDMTLEKFKGLPNNSELMRTAIFTSFESGAVPTKEALEMLTEIDIESIIDSPEGKTALYRGVQKLIERGLDKKIKEVVIAGRLDISHIQSDPQTLKNVRGYLHYQIFRDRIYEWPTELISLLDLSEESLRDMKITMACQLILDRSRSQPGKAFEMLSEIKLTAEDEESISSALFKTPHKFTYLKKVQDTFGSTITSQILDLLIKNHEQLSNKKPEQLQAYLTISQELLNSPSQEIARIKDELIEQILSTDNPERTYNIISSVFIQNNLPLVGKIQRIFDALHPDRIFSEKLQENSSPVLKEASSRARRSIVFKDLLKVHIESGNRSLRTFLRVIDETGPLVEKMEANTLSESEERRIQYVFRKLKTLTDVSQRGRQNFYPPVSGESLQADYVELRKQLGVKEGQSVSDRVVDMFARPLGYGSVQEVLSHMTQAKSLADTRSRESATKEFRIEAGDLAKGVPTKYIDNILQNGSVAKEFLGASSNSDSTPFDTDIEYITSSSSGDFKKDFKDNIGLSNGYGDITFVVKDREQFQKTAKDGHAKYDPKHYELFETGGKNHYGIRTGFPCTEVDFIIARQEDPKRREDLFYSIAQNGYYIPVVDTDGRLLFSPDAFDEYRRIFAGVEKFDGPDMKFLSSSGLAYHKEIKTIISNKGEDRERLEGLKKEIRQLVLGVLEENGVKLKEEFDDSLLGAELIDIGSTGRDTSMPGEGDFDLTLKLDAKDFPKQFKIEEDIMRALGPEMSQAPLRHSTGEHSQMRFFGSNVFSQKGLDIDIGFVKKSELAAYASHDAISDKLNNIKMVHGEQAYQETVANILLAKKWLKEGGAYKKGNHGDGGLGGIGVENLILAYRGNLALAFRVFNEASQKADGSVKSLEEFKQDFKLLDAGINLRFNNHDNFTYNMNQSGYEKMLSVIQAHLPELSAAA